MTAIEPDIVKYFYEEPAALETLTPDDDPDARRRESENLSLEDFLNAPRYYRGYLAGTSLSEKRVGLTALPRREELLELLLEVRAGRPLQIWLDGHEKPQREPALLLDDPANVHVAFLGETGLTYSQVATLAAGTTRSSLPAIRAILDRGTPLLFTEAAHDGFDWSLFSPFPILENVRRGLQTLARPGLRAFAIPHRRARSEEKFYFERYDLDLFSEFEVQPG